MRSIKNIGLKIFVSFMMILAIITGFFTFGSNKVYAYSSQGNSVYYFTDTNTPYLSQANLMYFSDYNVMCYDRNEWYNIFQNPSMHELFDAGHPYTLLDMNGSVDDHNDVGGIVILELQNYFADGNMLNILFQDLQTNGHRVIFISGYTQMEYRNMTTDSFIQSVDRFIYIKTIGSFVRNTMNDILNVYGGFDNIKLIFAAEFFPGYQQGMSLSYLYDNYQLMNLIINYIASYFSEIIDSSTVEQFLNIHGIECYIYDEYDNIFNIFDGSTVTIDYDEIDNNVPYFAISINTMSQAFYNYLIYYQRSRGITSSNYDDETINKLRIYIYGDMLYSPDGLIYSGTSGSDEENDYYINEDYVLECLIELMV